MTSEARLEPVDPSDLPLFTQPIPAANGFGAHAHARRPASLRNGDAPFTDSAAVDDTDWSLVAALRAQASEQLSQAVAADRGRLDRAAQEELGRSIVLDLIESTVADTINAGGSAWPVAQQDAMARAVFDS